MRNERLRFSAIVLLCFGLTGLQAQESVSATGGNASGSGGYMSYSVGQVAFQTHTGKNVSMAEGVQQPYEIFVITAIEETNGITLSISAYPNPVSDYLILSIDEFEIADSYYQLYDVYGKLLQNKKITGNQTIIRMNDLSSSIYFLRVAITRNGTSQEVKTFKIIKK